MSGALECLHSQFRGQYQTDVETSCNAIFANNPRITPMGNEAERLKMEYPLIHKSDSRPVHFIQGYVEWLGEKLGIPLECSVNRPYLYLNEREKTINQVADTGYKGKFWLVSSGIKADYTTKLYPFYQEVIDHYRGKIQFVQVGESGHNHKPLTGTLNFIGKTDTRQLIRLAYQSVGGLGGVSFLHHIYASFQKPFVCVASGMESATWERYNTEVYLTRQGKMNCCAQGGCWRGKVVKEQGAGRYCELPVLVPDGQPYAKCMGLIEPMEVIRAIDSYYLGGLCSH